MIEAHFSVSLGDFSLVGEMGDKGLIHLSGENGSGKSTFLKALAGLIPIESGEIIVNGTNVREEVPQARRVVYATQNSYFSHLTVQKHIMWAMSEHPNREYMEELKGAFGISYEGKLRDLSLGQKMRVSLATAFASNPRVILLDELLSNISNPAGLLEEVKRISGRESIDVVYVAHSLLESSADHRYSVTSGRMERLS